MHYSTYVLSTVSFCCFLFLLLSTQRLLWNGGSFVPKPCGWVGPLNMALGLGSLVGSFLDRLYLINT